MARCSAGIVVRLSTVVRISDATKYSSNASPSCCDLISCHAKITKPNISSASPIFDSEYKGMILLPEETSGGDNEFPKTLMVGRYSPTLFLTTGRIGNCTAGLTSHAPSSFGAQRARIGIPPLGVARQCGLRLRVVGR